MSCQKDTCVKCNRETIGSPCVFCLSNNCVTKYTTNCVVYNGNELACYGIDSGASLTEVLLTLLAYVFPNC
jgi:hypothetical protein